MTTDRKALLTRGYPEDQRFSVAAWHPERVLGKSGDCCLRVNATDVTPMGMSRSVAAEAEGP
jgi:hypothetical protein